MGELTALVMLGCGAASYIISSLTTTRKYGELSMKGIGFFALGMLVGLGIMVTAVSFL